LTALTAQPNDPAATRTIVSIADMAVSNRPDAVLVTYALGSCIGVTLYDPVAKVGGMLHFMLPQLTTPGDRGNKNPLMFADLGVPMLFQKAYELGARKERLIVCAAGGAEILADEGHFKIGSRNRTMLRKLFWKNSVLLAAEDTGGNHSRTLTMYLADGRVTVKNKQEERTLWAA
jgi:chemotaxis protein CheD